MGGAVCAALPEMVNLFVSGLSGLGGGDIRLMFAAGCLLGVDGGLYALLISGILVLGFTLCYGALKKTDVSGLRIPYGPFLSCGIAWMLAVDLFQDRIPDCVWRSIV